MCVYREGWGRLDSTWTEFFHGLKICSILQLLAISQNHTFHEIYLTYFRTYSSKTFQLLPSDHLLKIRKIWWEKLEKHFEPFQSRILASFAPQPRKRKSFLGAFFITMCPFTTSIDMNSFREIFQAKFEKCHIKDFWSLFWFEFWQEF